MEQYIYHVGDEVTISAKVVNVTASENLIVSIGGNKCLIKPGDVKSVHPYQPIPETDARKGK